MPTVAPLPLRRRVVGLLPMSLRRPLHRVLYYRDLLHALWRKPVRECPCCGQRARFRAAGIPPRLEAACPRCGALERHRLLALTLRAHELFRADDELLHFAPESVVRRLVQPRVRAYLCADLYRGPVDLRLDIERIALEDARFDVVLCNHVLEHVDDRRALAELFRILRPHGRLIAMVPIVEGWTGTYEDPSIVAPGARALHFGRADHVRLYGADFRARLAAAGFRVEEFTTCGADVVRYGLWPGEKVFVGHKPAALDPPG